MQRYAPYLAGVGVAFIFGFSFLFTRVALDHVAPFHLLGFRFAFALTAMYVLRVLGLIKIEVSMADYRSLLPLALFQPIIYFSSETIGIKLTSSSYAGMMIAVIPIFVVILAALLLHEYPSRMQIPFIIASVAGVLLIMTMDNRSAVGASLLGSLTLIVTVLSAAGFTIASRKASVHYPPLHITWIMMVFGAVVFNGIALIQHLVAGNISNYLVPLGEVWSAVLYLGFLSSVVAFFLLNYMLSRITAAQSSVFANMVTVIAIFAGVLLRGELFFWYHAAGIVAILTGVWGTNRFAK